MKDMTDVTDVTDVTDMTDVTTIPREIGRRKKTFEINCIGRGQRSTLNTQSDGHRDY